MKTKSQYPLKKIVAVLRSATDAYSRNQVELECGHVVFATGIYKARCWKCRKET